MVAGPGRLETSAASLRTWTDEFGEVRAQIVVTARNTGGAAVAVPGSQTTWRVLDQAGQVVTSGRFARAFPPVVASGESVQLIEAVTATFADPEELATLDVTLVSRPADGGSPAVMPLDVSAITWEANTNGSVRVSGEVANTTHLAVHDVAVAVVLRGDAAQVLAGAYDVSLGSLEPGASATFSTDYPGTPMIDVALIATAEASAFGMR